MTRTKKLLSGALVVVLLLVIVLFFVANHLLESYSRQTMSALARRSKKHGVVIVEPQFQAASITGIRTARWSNLYAELQFPRSEAFDPAKVFEVRVGELDLWLHGGGQVTLEAQDIEIDVTEPPEESDTPVAGGETQHERIEAKQFRCQFDLELFNPMPGLENALPELIGLMQTGSSSIPIVAEGTLEFTLQSSPMKVGIEVKQLARGQTLVLSKTDLRLASDRFAEALTDAEIELISAYPLRVAQLLRIKNDAESTSEAAKERRDHIPQDAYRHVLWSYLLTKKYGAEFAQRVTDAHEQGDTGNTPAEREMDYANNAVGRRYAEEKVRRNKILLRLMSDPEVVLAAE